jgi:integrase
MANLVNRDGRWRALVRKGGHVRCETFGSRAQAKAWAAAIERQIEELRASGVMSAKGLTLGDLIDRYREELYTLKPWGRTKSADLARLKGDLGALKADALTNAHFTDYFRKRFAEGTGAVVISAQAGYLVGVLRVARTVLHLDVNLQAALDAREALKKLRLVGKSQRRERRVSDIEIARLVKHFRKAPGTVPMADIVHFSLATGMRISEVCRLTWADLDTKARTVIVRNRKHPQDKIGNDMIVPLLAATGFDAFKIASRQRKGGARIFPYNSRTVSTYFTRAAAALGLDDLHLHDLRHEAISRLFEAGFQIQQVALVSGHRDWGSLKRYTHVKAADLHRQKTTAPTPNATPRVNALKRQR